MTEKQNSIAFNPTNGSLLHLQQQFHQQQQNMQKTNKNNWDFGNLNRIYQLQLTSSPPSPGDPFMWTIHGELPQICRHLFGSPTSGSGLLSMETMSVAERVAVLDFLNPNGGFIQYILKTSAERIYYDINFDALPLPIQHRLETFADNQTKYYQTTDLPHFIKERLQNTHSASHLNDSSTVKDSTSSTASINFKLRFTMAEYFIFYFLYYATLPTAIQQQQQLADIKRAASIISVTSGGMSGDTHGKLASAFSISALSSTGVNQVAIAKLVNSVYSEVLHSYLDFFLPWQLIGADSNSGTGISHGNLPKCVFECSFIDRNAQLSLSQFFVEAMCDMWMTQSDLSCSSPAMDPPASIPGYELFQMILMAETHILSMDLNVALSSSNMKYGSFEELSLWNPMDWLQSSSFRVFKIHFYRLLRLVLSNFSLSHEIIPFELLTKLLFVWLSPSNADIKLYMAENLLFFTSLFDEYLGILSSRLPLNGILLQLNNPTSGSQIIPESTIRDIKNVTTLFQNSYNLGTVEWLALCEQLLVNSNYGNQRIFEDEYSGYAQQTQESFAQLDGNQAVKYNPIIGSTAGGAAKLMKRLYQFEIFLLHIDSISGKEAVNTGNERWISSFLTPSRRKPTINVKSQLRTIKECLTCLRLAFNDSEDLILQWKEEADSLVNDATVSGEMGETFKFQRPETEFRFKDNTGKLTRRGVKQILSGEQKCSKRDLPPPKWNVQDVSRIKSSEFEVLVKLFVGIGLFLNRIWPRLLDYSNVKLKIWTNGTLEIPDSLYDIDFCWLRLMASEENLGFALLVAITIKLILWIFV